MLSENQMVSVRNALEKAYSGICSIYEYQNFKDSSGITHKREILSAENIRCQLSFENSLPAAASEFSAQALKKVKLFLPPDIKVKEGSKIIVEQNGSKFLFSASGAPSVYFSHQEIAAEKLDRLT